MDEDGYRVTSTTSTLESPTISSVETSQMLNEKPPQSDLLLEGSSSNTGTSSHSINGAAPEGFHIEIGNLGEKIYQCDVCEYSSVKKTALLRDHYNFEHKKKVLECTECTYSTLRYKTLQQHRQNRHGLLAMECSFESDGTKCTFRSILEDVMIEHYATKHGIQKEPSNKTKEVYDRNILMKYKREGPDGRPVRRPHKHRLDRSQRVFDTTREENEQGGYTYTYNCVFCGFESSKQETVEAHANKQHIGRQLKCPDCSFESYYKTNLQVHIKKVHGRKAENCIVPGCKFRSLFTSKIQVHLFSKHHGYYDEDRHSIMVPLK